MNDSQFEEQVRKVVPTFIVSQFKHLIQAIPEKYRMWFINLVKGGCDMKEALRLVASPSNNRTIKEYLHLRMQDNMSEILD